MKLSVPANYDRDLIDTLADYPVAEVYGKLGHDPVGGGRSTLSTEGISKSSLKAYIACLRESGIDFNYLLNSACLGNRPWDRRWQKKLNRLLETLTDFGVKRITISIPLLFQMIRKRFPRFSLKVGIFAQVDTVERARYWEDLGADEITLESFSINRNFDRLQDIRQAVRCSLQLIVNHPCLLNCPMQIAHQNGFAHSSDGSRGIFIDDCLLRCSAMRLEDPSKFIRSSWIRPEDLSRYETIGYDSFKLLERNIPSDELLKRVRAYSRRQFKGNLADLILPYGFSKTPPRSRGWLLRHFFKPFRIRPGKLKPFYELAKMQGMLFPLDQQPICIDSAKIPDDFLSAFEGKDCAMIDCRNCGYCGQIAERAVCVDDGYRKRVLGKFEQVNHQITSGELWNV